MSRPDRPVPPGRYFSVPIDIGPDYGGQTRALMMRNRLFVHELGLRPTVLTFSPRADWPERTEAMLQQGMLLPEIATRNIYEHYRDTPWWDDAATEVAPAEGEVEHDSRGLPWRQVVRDRAGAVVHTDYLRADGSPFVRVPPFTFKEPKSWPRRIDRLGRDGVVLGQFGSLGQWFRRYVRDMTEGERSFVFIDSRFNAQHIVPMRAPHVHLVYMLHNIHVLPPRQWNSPTSRMYKRLMTLVPHTDAFVTLTARQRDDIALRVGATDNLFTIPNPVETSPAPDEVRRDPHLVVIVARLEDQKRLTDAVDAFARVVAQVPEARLRIYGEGTERRRIEQHVAAAGLGEQVRLMGHDSRARDVLWQASAFIVTSAYEGWNLALQESMNHGCPVVSYDVRYGPREQITDGEDGYLVAPGDVAALADRVVDLVRSPALVERLGSAAREKLRRSPHDFVARWTEVLNTVVDLAPARIGIRSVDLRVHHARTEPAALAARHLPDRLVRWSSALGRRPVAHVCGDLTVTLGRRSSPAGLADARVTATVVDPGTEATLEVPVEVEVADRTVRFSTRFEVERVVGSFPITAETGLRLLLTCHNASWQTTLPLPWATDTSGSGTRADGTSAS